MAPIVHFLVEFDQVPTETLLELIWKFEGMDKFTSEFVAWKKDWNLWFNLTTTDSPTANVCLVEVKSSLISGKQSLTSTGADTYSLPSAVLVTPTV